MERTPATASGTWDNTRRPTLVRGKAKELPDWHTDPVLFARKAGLEPDGPRVRVLRSSARQGILNCTRQWGKSTVTAAKALHHGLTGEKRLVVVGCPTARQSAEFLRKASGMLSAFGIVPGGDGIHEASLLLPNGSRIVGLPQNEEGVRGLSGVTLLTGSIFSSLRGRKPAWRGGSSCCGVVSGR